MRSASTILLLFFFVFTTAAQTTIEFIIRNAETSEPLPGATASIKALGIGASADENGILKLDGVPPGEHVIEFSFLGFEAKTVAAVFPSGQSSPMQVVLDPDEEELEEIVITSTRSSRTIADIPTRVEFIAGEELDEKANMKPGDIRMLLSESTGIQTQQTSATSANSSIRIQGLDGRYTQILKDGFPLYAGFSGGLGLLQTPPLDLKQVEVIKGSSSTLYGGGAIAGMVNLISRVPTDERALKFFINGTSALGLDVSGFYGEKYGKVGVTVFGSRHSSVAYDPADIDLSAIPEYRRYTFHPKVFVDLDQRTSLMVGGNFTTEERVGGDMHYIEGNGDATHQYFERNESDRYSTQLSLKRSIGENKFFVVKNSYNYFDRNIQTPGYVFDGVQRSTFTELSFSSMKQRSEWIAGLNLWTDNFTETQTTATPVRDYEQTTFGGFVQNTLSVTEKVILESGVRGDYVVDYGFVLLPRISLLVKMTPDFTTRIGGGFGYKAPTIFTEESERLHYRNLMPVSPVANDLEKSYGGNVDLNYHASLGNVYVSVNQLFFYTLLDNPLFVAAFDNENVQLLNIAGHVDTRGTETNIKLEYGDFKLFLGYTFTDTKIHSEGRQVQNPLTPKHRMNNVLMYEAEDKWKIGLEAYYFGKQRLNDNTFGRDYWICGFMVEKLWEKFSLFVNFENFLDARQTRFDTIYTGSITNPAFRDIYAPVDGFVINGGLKLDL
jgi:outer membrane receptor for ferrienterochelin and colicins